MNDNSWIEYIQNPRLLMLKKFMLETLKDKYTNFDEVISRIGTQLVTERDLQSFTQMINEIYKMGYANASANFQQQLGKQGIQIAVTQDQQKAIPDQQKTADVR